MYCTAIIKENELLVICQWQYIDVNVTFILKDEIKNKKKKNNTKQEKNKKKKCLRKKN